MLKTSVRWVPTVLAAVAATALALGISAAVAGPKPTTHTVVIEDMHFHPEELTVKVGDTIVWKNRDAVAHTATAADKQFDSHDIASGRSWKHTAKKAGVIDYHCSVHPTMLGKLHVE